jgi:hypothetical protein
MTDAGPPVLDYAPPPRPQTVSIASSLALAGQFLRLVFCAFGIVLTTSIATAPAGDSYRQLPPAWGLFHFATGVVIAILMRRLVERRGLARLRAVLSFACGSAAVIALAAIYMNVYSDPGYPRTRWRAENLRPVPLAALGTAAAVYSAGQICFAVAARVRRVPDDHRR